MTVYMYRKRYLKMTPRSKKASLTNVFHRARPKTEADR